MQGFLALTPRLTWVQCECCGRVEDDGVAHLLIAEAVLMYMLARRAKRDRDDRAYRDAQAQIDAVRAGR